MRLELLHTVCIMLRYVIPSFLLPGVMQVFKMTHVAAVSFQWMEAGQSGQSGLPVEQSAPTGEVVSARPRRPGTEESTAAAA